MKVRGNSAPTNAFLLHLRPKKPGYVTVRFFENVQPFENEERGITVRGFEYDEYDMELPAEDGLEQKILDNFDSYFAQAKAADPESEASLAAAKEEMQAENNAALAAFLAAHPLLWQDGKLYGVTQQDQQEIALNLTQYQLVSGAGLPAKLEWHAVHEECREFTPEELTALAVAISNYVYPLVRQNQTYKVQIFGAASLEQLKEVSFTYEEVE